MFGMIMHEKERQMKIRLAVPEEAEECWNIRNLLSGKDVSQVIAPRYLKPGHPKRCLNITGR
jgi:hypothetical protein